MFPEFSVLATYILACIAIVIVPGPTVTVIIANSLKFGTRAGFINIAGTQAGLAVMMVVLALGLEALTTTLAWVFEWVRIAGAIYLIWLGYKFLTSDGQIGQPDETEIHNEKSLFWQGFVVILSNPKALLFFGSFLPQFIDPSGSTALQTLFLGSIFMVVATLFDGGYAVMAGRAGQMLTHQRVRAAEITSGSFMIGGGLWLAFGRN